MPLQAIDVWMGACTAFIFAALIEFTVVNYLFRKHRSRFGYEHERPYVDEFGDERMELTQVRRHVLGAYYYQQLFTTFLQFPAYKVIVGSLRAS